jgi:microcystin-dependent protein
VADPFVAEIRIFPFTFAPKGWAFCDGQLMPLSQNTALFSLVGTFYGGDGKSTFALPDLQGSAPMFHGQGPGLSLHDLGENSGTQTVTLLQSEIPVHTHNYSVSFSAAGSKIPTNLSLAQGAGVGMYAPASGNPQTSMAPQSLAPSGGGLPHNTMQPYLTFNFNIALQGVFPPRQ